MKRVERIAGVYRGPAPRFYSYATAVEVRELGEENGRTVDPLRRRARERRQRIETNKAPSFTEAEDWDLAYWQARTPEERLEACMALREDMRKAEVANEATREAANEAPRS